MTKLNTPADRKIIAAIEEAMADADEHGTILDPRTGSYTTIGDYLLRRGVDIHDEHAEHHEAACGC